MASALPLFGSFTDVQQPAAAPAPPYFWLRLQMYNMTFNVQAMAALGPLFPNLERLWLGRCRLQTSSLVEAVKVRVLHGQQLLGRSTLILAPLKGTLTLRWAGPLALQVGCTLEVSFTSIRHAFYFICKATILLMPSMFPP